MTQTGHHCVGASKFGTMVRVDGTSHLAITAGPNANTHVIIDVVGFYWDWQLTTT